MAKYTSICAAWLTYESGSKNIVKLPRSAKILDFHEPTDATLFVMSYMFDYAYNGDSEWRTFVIVFREGYIELEPHESVVYCGASMDGDYRLFEIIED